MKKTYWSWFSNEDPTDIGFWVSEHKHDSDDDYTVLGPFDTFDESRLQLALKFMEIANEYSAASKTALETSEMHEIS